MYKYSAQDTGWTSRAIAFPFSELSQDISVLQTRQIRSESRSAFCVAGNGGTFRRGKTAGA